MTNSIRFSASSLGVVLIALSVVLTMLDSASHLINEVLPKRPNGE